MLFWRLEIYTFFFRIWHTELLTGLLSYLSRISHCPLKSFHGAILTGNLATYSFAQISAAGWGLWNSERRSEKSLPNLDHGMKGSALFLISQLNLLGAGILPHSWPSRVGGRKRWWLSMEMATASKYFLGPKVGCLSDIFAFRKMNSF